jgi:CRP-like cAMP-binding protein
MDSKKCSCHSCQLKDLFFGQIPDDEIAQICNKKTERSFAKGEVIINQDDEILDFLYMKEGLVKLFRKLPDGKDQIISFSCPMDFVSLLSVFSSNKYKYSVSAVVDSTVCSLDMGFIKNHALNNAQFVMNLMSKVSEATDKIIIENLEIKRKQLRGRVAHVLLFFAEHVYDSQEFELPVSRREIGEYIGMTTENVIRTLSEFRNHGIIKILGKKILIIDRKRLETISEFG